ncbi:uncharacterized protein [Drosophila takahashii]|uniref:uncharacterized protein n=1 Tax=Drosophila takahashii TaxID=29030 RepID=UPI0038993E36
MPYTKTAKKNKINLQPETPDKPTLECIPKLNSTMTTSFAHPTNSQDAAIADNNNSTGGDPTHVSGEEMDFESGNTKRRHTSEDDEYEEYECDSSSDSSTDCEEEEDEQSNLSNSELQGLLQEMKLLREENKRLQAIIAKNAKSDGNEKNNMYPPLETSGSTKYQKVQNKKTTNKKASTTSNAAQPKSTSEALMVLNAHLSGK